MTSLLHSPILMLNWFLERFRREAPNSDIFPQPASLHPLPFSFPPITVHSTLTLIRRLSGIEPDPTKPQPVALPYKLESPSYLTPNDKRNEAGNWKVKLCGASRLKPRSAYFPGKKGRGKKGRGKKRRFSVVWSGTGGS